MTDLDRRADAAPPAWPLEEVYDAETLALIEGSGRRGPTGTGTAARTGPGVPPAGRIDGPPTPVDPPAAGDGDPGGPAGLAAGGPGGDRAARRGRGGLAALALSGAMIGVAEVLDPEGLQPAIVEFVPDQPDPESLPVQFVCVPGDPRASRLIIRPWLFRR